MKYMRYAMHDVYLYKVLHIQNGNQNTDERKRKINKICRSNIQSVRQKPRCEMHDIFQDNSRKPRNNTYQETQNDNQSLKRNIFSYPLDNAFMRKILQLFMEILNLY